MDISLSFRITINRVLSEPALFMASNAIPALIAPSPMTATTLLSRPSKSRAMANPRAAEMEGHVPIEVINERIGELMDLQREISFEKNTELIGQRSEVLVDQLLEDDDEFDATGRTRGQALDIDGVTNLSNAGDIKSGSMIEVEIIESLDYDLIGKVT